MAERTPIYEGTVDVDKAGHFLLLAYLDLDEENGIFTVHYELQQKEPKVDDPRICSFHVTFSITNPLGLLAFSLGTAKMYGVCVGWRMSRFTIRTVKESYTHSRKQLPDMTRLDRAKDVSSRMTNMGGEFGAETKKALVDCLPVVKWFTGDKKNGNGENGNGDMPEF